MWIKASRFYALQAKLSEQQRRIEFLESQLCPDGHHYYDIDQHTITTTVIPMIDTEIHTNQVCKRCGRRHLKIRR